MSDINCHKCTNWKGQCRYSMRAAATANGTEPEDETEVHFCREFDELEENDVTDDWRN